MSTKTKKPGRYDYELAAYAAIGDLGSGADRDALTSATVAGLVRFGFAEGTINRERASSAVWEGLAYPDDRDAFSG